MRFQLDNGLTWVYAPLHHSPVVAIQIWVKVGIGRRARARARPGAPARAHALQGHRAARARGDRPRRRGPRRRDQRLDQLRPDRLPRGPRQPLLSARARHPRRRRARLDASTPGELGREIEVVVEEIKRSMDMPSRRVSKALFALAYRAHPYGRPVIGSIESRARLQPREDARLLRQALPPGQHRRGRGRRREPRARARPRSSSASAATGVSAAHRRAARRGARADGAARAGGSSDDVKEAHLSLAFPIPDIDAPDLPALDVLAVMLGQGEGSRLELCGAAAKRSGDRRRTPTPTRRSDPGLLSVDATLAPEKLNDAIRRAVARGVPAARGAGASRRSWRRRSRMRRGRRHLPARDGAGPGAAARLLRGGGGR